MTIVQSTLLVFGLAMVARGVYALVSRDIVEEGEPVTGAAAVRFGVFLIVFGGVVASHAVHPWPWITAAVGWLRTQ